MTVQKTEKEWREELSPDRYEVMRNKATEPAFTGKYTYSKDQGMYRCGACGADLFSSDTDKAKELQADWDKWSAEQMKPLWVPAKKKDKNEEE